MSFLRRLPWFSSFLLMISYAIFGKYLFSTDHSWLTISLAIGWGLILAIMMLSPLTGFERLLVRWFRSDTVAFSSLVAFAALASILLTWFKLFLPFITLLCTEALARIDIQTAEFSQLQALLILTLTAWLGLGLGWAVSFII